MSLLQILQEKRGKHFYKAAEMASPQIRHLLTSSRQTVTEIATSLSKDLPKSPALATIMGKNRKEIESLSASNQKELLEEICNDLDYRIVEGTMKTVSNYRGSLVSLRLVGETSWSFIAMGATDRLAMDDAYLQALCFLATMSKPNTCLK